MILVDQDLYGGWIDTSHIIIIFEYIALDSFTFNL